MKILASILLLAITGCAQPDNPEWMTAPTNYKCTTEQAKQVDYETRTCESTGGWSGYSGQYCYGSAIIRNCQKNIGGTLLTKVQP